MGFRFQKSISIGKLFRINLSKSGIGFSGGFKGFRIGAGPRGKKATFSLPGTGLSYVKHFGGKKKKKDEKDEKDPKPQAFTKELFSEYLNEKKLIKANSEWELELKEKAQLEKWAKKENALKLKNEQGDLMKKAEDMTLEAQNKMEEMNNILNHTLRVDDKLDWKEQKKKTKGVDQWKKDFENGEEVAIEKYAQVVLSNSVYPEEIDQDYEVDYIKDEKLLIISYKLPGIEDIPNVKEYVYSSVKKDIVKKDMSISDFEKFYSSIIFQMTLRTIHEMFESFYTDALESVAFNGWVSHVDKATGNDAISCVVSINVKKEDFEKINLSKIDYKSCIDSLGGIYSKKFTKVSPIMPLVDIDNYDSEFVDVEEE